MDRGEVTREFTSLRLALAQINTTVGDIAGNSALILDSLEKVAAEGAHIALFPEMTITGYPVEDLALRSTFRAASKKALLDLATQIAEKNWGEILVVVGYLDESESRKPQNAIALIHRGEVVAT